MPTNPLNIACGESGRTRSLEFVVAIVAWLALLAMLWSAICWTPFPYWNAARVYPAYLLAAGEPIYMPMNEGIANGWIYGPVLPLLCLPFTYLADETWAMVAMAWLHVALLLIPLLLVLDRALERPAITQGRWLFAAFAAGLVILLPTTAGRLVFITADTPAIAFTCLSCLALHSARVKERTTLLWWAAGFAAAAVWSKQTEALVPVAQFAWLMGRGHRTIAGKYFLATLVIQVAALGAAVLAFGWDALVFNLITIPSHHPWTEGWKSVLQEGLTLAGWVLPSVVLWLLWRFRQSRHPTPPVASTALAEMLLMVGVFLYPLNVLAAAKVGGMHNSFHAVYFFALAAAIVWIGPAGDWLHPRRTWRSLAVLGAVAAAVLHTHRLLPVSVLPDPTLSESVAMVKTYPGTTYFPQNPLATWLGERRQYHFDYGLYDQALAGFSPSRERFWRGLPPRLERVVYPRATEGILLAGLLPATERKTYVGRFIVLDVQTATATPGRAAGK